MKPNPKLHHFIENKIGNTKDTPYILLEKGDTDKIQTLIKETASNKENRDMFLQRIEERDPVLTYLPYKFVDELVNSLIYGRRETGRHKVWKLLNQLFPNWEELHIVHGLGGNIRDYNNALECIEEGLKDLSEITKEKTNATI